MRGATASSARFMLIISISIHTPHAGSDAFHFCACRSLTDFNPHSPCGERHQRACIRAGFALISIHTPHAGSDDLCKLVGLHKRRFQSTLPMRGATLYFLSGNDVWTVFQSTLPMRGATKSACERSQVCCNFNPHSPCGERRRSQTRTASYPRIFQSTLPMRGATANIAKTIFVNLYDLSRSRGSIINI